MTQLGMCYSSVIGRTLERRGGWLEDEYGITLVNFKKLIHTRDKISDDPYVLSS